MGFVLEILAWWLLAIVKFLFLPWIMILASGKGLLETILVTASGATVGVYVIAFFGDRLFQFLSERGRKKGTKVFTPGRRRIVRIKNRYGLKGLLVLSGFISVPITTLLAVKYYRHTSLLALKVSAGFAVWSVMLSCMAYGIKTLYHG